VAIGEQERFEVLLTGDQNLSYQQNDRKRTISLVLLTEIDRKRRMAMSLAPGCHCP